MRPHRLSANRASLLRLSSFPRACAEACSRRGPAGQRLQAGALTLALFFVFALMSPVQAWGDGIGTQVTGDVNYGYGNYLDTAYGMVTNSAWGNYGLPSGDTTVTIGPGIEFGLSGRYNSDTIDFTGDTMTLVDDHFGNRGFSVFVSFSDPSFTGFTEDTADSTLTITNFNFDSSTDTVSFNFGSGSHSGNAQLVLDYTSLASPSVTPEPNSLMLLGTGLAAAAGIMRRRFRQVHGA